jgi:hypothetical protein
VNRKSTILALALTIMGGALLAPAAQARPRDRDYRNDRDYRYDRDYRNDRRSSGPRERLRERVFQLSDRIRLADRERRISPREADQLNRRLDRVRNFLRDDDNLSREEFERRMRDLDNIQDDLREEVRDERRDRRYRY